MSFVPSRRSFADRVGLKSTSGLGSLLTRYFEVSPEFLAKVLRKLRVTRAVAARSKSEFGIRL